MEATAILLDRKNQEIKIYFGHTNYCVSAPLTSENYNLYCYFNNIKGAELMQVNIVQKKILDDMKLSFDELISL